MNKWVVLFCSFALLALVVFVHYELQHLKRISSLAARRALSSLENTDAAELTTAKHDELLQGDIVFLLKNNFEVIRFKPDGTVIASPDLKPDEAASAVLDALKNLSPAYFKEQCKHD